MPPIVPSSDNFSQDSFPNSASLEKFEQDYREHVDRCCYEDVVERSGVRSAIYYLNHETAIGVDVYESIFADSDKTNNSGISLEASRNLARCMGDTGYFYKGKFWLLSDLCGASNDARNGSIKSKGDPRPEGSADGGYILNGRFRQVTGAPIALDEKGRPRKYHQAKGKPLEVFLPNVDVIAWEEIATRYNLP